MEVLESVSQPSAISFHIDLPRASYMPDPTHYVKSAAAFSVSSTNVLGLSQNHYSVHKRTKSAALVRGFCQKKFNTSTNSSGKVFHGASASDSADLGNDVSKVDRPIKRNSRKKGKRRGNQHRKLPSLCSTDGMTVLDEVICGTSIFESHSSIAASYGNKNILSNSLPESAEVCSMSPEFSATPTSAFDSGEEDESETQASLSQCFSGDDSNQLVLSGRNPNLVNCKSMIYTSDAILSNFDGEVADGNQKQCSIRDDSSSGILSDEYGPPILDSFSDCSNSDGSPHGGDTIDIQTCTEGGNRVDLFDSRRVLDYSSYGTSLNDTRNTKEILIHRTPCNSRSERSNTNSPQSKAVDNYTDRSRCGGHECCSSDFLSVKKGRQGRKLPGSMSGVRRLSSIGNMHGRAGKENGHSVWQKVQKDDLGECVFYPKKANAGRSNSNGSQVVPSCVRHDTFVCPRKSEHEISTRSTCLEETCAQADVAEGPASVFDSDVSSVKSVYDNLRNRDSEKLKRKPCLGSKEENQNSRKGPHSGKSNLIRCSKINMQQKKALENPKPVIYDKSFGADLRSPCADNQRVGTSLTNRVNWHPSQPLQNAQIHLEETKLLGPVCTAISDMVAQAAQNLVSPLSMTSDALAQTHALKVDSEINSKFHKDLPGFPSPPMSNKVNESAKLEIDIPQAERGRQDHSSSSISQKWVPVGRKDCMLDTCRSEKLSTNHLEEVSPDGWDPKKIPEDPLSSNSPGLLTNATVACPGLDSGSVNLRSPVDEGQADNLTHYSVPSMRIKHSSTHCMTNHHSTLEDDNGRISLFVTNANEIAQVVNDAHRLQIESEKIQLATGRPLAEFERLLHSASPVIAQAFGFQNCYTCKGDRPIGNSLCRHQIPNISLASVWQWYEGPGSYGLEVKAEDHRNSKRMGRDRFEFRAYFVPSLSAAQFFSRCGSSMCCSSDDKPNTDLETSDNSSHLDKVFSILLPRPRRGENTSVSPPMTSSSPSYSSATSNRDGHCTSFAQACYDDSELLFEYFESEQPQQRLPLFEKIKELVRGHTTPHGQIYGDPSKLDCLRLHDLHPSSWYSVAWYPIYRIPDGNLRAAFLTYHSLAHFIHRGSSLELGGATCVVSPAVGLQSYNAQGECWFQQRKSMIQTEEDPCFNPSKILRERLRTLEQTAAVMARASVRKGDQKSINRQPDYEFFLSRRR